VRLRDRREEFLCFTTDFAVASSNNVAEQAVRMIKVSGGFRTLPGAAAFLAIRGYLSTARKNGQRAVHARAARPSLDATDPCDLNSRLRADLDKIDKIMEI
jgi:hypothetical protein